MKRKALAIVLTLLMLVSVLPMGAFAASETDTTVPAEAETKAASYTDTEGHWGEAAIERWTQAKNSADQAVLEGMGNNTYAPDENLTRAQAMTIFSRLLNLVETADISKVTDVASDAWYAQWIEKGYAYEIIKGTSDTTFDPDGSITREQFFSIFARAMGIPGAEKCDKEFTDLDQVSSWFVEEGTVYAMVNAGYLDGYPDGSLQPKGNITRAEVAQVLANAIDSKGYITADGTYDLTGMTDMVVVLAKNATLTGTYTGHIVSSCVNSTLYTTKVNPSTVKAAVNTAADNVKVSNVGVANPPYTPANPYNPSGANYVYVLQDNTVINPVAGGSGGGGGGGLPAYNVTVSLGVPFSKVPGQIAAGPYYQDQKMSTVLKDLSNDTDGVKEAVQAAFNKVFETKTNTYGGYTITVTPNFVGEDVNTISISMKDSANNAVNVQNVVEKELKLLTDGFAEKANIAGLTGVAGWSDFVAQFDADKLFTFENSGLTVTTKEASDYATFVSGLLSALGTVSENLPADYDFASNIKAVTGNHWKDYYVFGDSASFSELNGVMNRDPATADELVLAAMLNVNKGNVISGTENPQTAVEAIAAFDDIFGRNYTVTDEVKAIIEGGFNNNGLNLVGQYEFNVNVTYN